MSIETEEPYSPGWWLLTLGVKLHERRAGIRGKYKFARHGLKPNRVRPGLDLLADYLAGDPPLREDIHSEWSAPFRQFLRMGRMNIAPKLVSSTTNRMGLRDFRTAAVDDELGDLKARDLMRHNKLKLRAREVHDNMLGLGDAYTIVTPPDDTRAWSLITSESPLECITAHDPATGETLAGLKMFRDEIENADYAYLFLPGELYVARCDVPTSTLFTGRRWALSSRWEWDYDRWDDIPGNKVAMVRFQNKNGVSEIEGELNTLDRINDKLFNEWWIGKIQAFRQRAIVMAEEDDEVPPSADGDEAADPMEMSDEEWAQVFTSAPDAMWKLPKGAEIWESKETNTQQLTESIKGELQWLAFTASKPLHLITPDAANGSAEGASTQKEEHTFELWDRQDRADASWAETMAMAFEFQGDTDRADVSQIEVIWGPTQLHSLQEIGETVSKVNGVLPWEAIMTDVMQYSPGDVVDRLRPQRSRDMLSDAAAKAAAERRAAPAGG
ncbi:phage portal protein [Nocardioides marmoriginsengisoli]|uniref:phage portal protein n=1 Tax=Nocardioides marmoriginsengisoli TaxID=661483 RepID=UPI00160C1655|nr:phage portal protein [Nocardioides marmoriginsengisoli]